MSFEPKSEIEAVQPGFSIRFSLDSGGTNSLYLNELGSFGTVGHAAHFSTFGEARQAWRRCFDAHRDRTVIEVIPTSELPASRVAS